MRSLYIIASLTCAYFYLAAPVYAYNGFDYLADIANAQHDQVCGPDYSGCNGFNGYSYDVAQADFYAAAGASVGSEVWNLLAEDGICDPIYPAQDRLSIAWYYLGLPDYDPDYNQSAGYEQAYNDAYYITSQVDAYLAYYLGDCLQ